MIERPILFSAPMVRAILDGTKKQTRRIIKDTGLYAIEPHHGPEVMKRERKALATTCPFGSPGARLWVRETHQLTITPDGEETYFIYAADFQDKDIKKASPWKPSIFMPRFASRITLEITDIRVERLNMISNTDILAEGFRSESCKICVHDGGSGCGSCRSIVKPFQDLWEKINGPDSWDKNPYVWVIEFKRLEQ